MYKIVWFCTFAHYRNKGKGSGGEFFFHSGGVLQRGGPQDRHRCGVGPAWGPAKAGRTGIAVARDRRGNQHHMGCIRPFA